MHQPIARPIDASVDVPAVEALEGCAGTAVPKRLSKRARAVRSLLVRADRTRRARTATLLRRAGKRLDALAAKAASQQRKGRLTPECEAAIEAAVEGAQSALACVAAASGG